MLGVALATFVSFLKLLPSVQFASFSLFLLLFNAALAIPFLLRFARCAIRPLEAFIPVLEIDPTDPTNRRLVQLGLHLLLSAP